MINSKFFWAGAILLAIIPALAMDIPKHYVDWTREVHDEMITTFYSDYQFSPKQKAVILTNILQSNKTLMASMYIKGFVSTVLLFFSIYFFSRYRKQPGSGFWKASGITVSLLAASVMVKIYFWTSFSGNDHIRLLSLSKADTTLGIIYNNNFKGKVVYVDFWGTTCGPCLEEFRNFTKPLKEQYKNRADIAYLYICGGRQIIWKQQLQKFDIQGNHIFLDTKAYAALYKQSIRGSKDTVVAMPRYLIIDKQGRIVETDAPRPSNRDSVTAKLDKYLALH